MDSQCQYVVFSNITEDYVREMKVKMGNAGAQSKVNGVGSSVMACLFVDDTSLLEERVQGNSKEQWMNSIVCLKKLKVSVAKSKVVVF